MTEEPVEQDGTTPTNEPTKEESMLQDFLQKRKLQISVLKKMLEQIPLDQDAGAPGENTNEQEKQ